MTHNRQKLKAFTLIELLVVVAIIALLLTILVPTISRARYQAKVARTKAQLQGISVALHNFANEQGDFPTSDPFSGGTLENPNMPSGAHHLAYALVGEPTGDLYPGVKKPYMAADKANVLSDRSDKWLDSQFNICPTVPADGRDWGGQGAFVIRDSTFDGPIIYYKANRRAKYAPDANVYLAARLGPKAAANAPEAAFNIADNAFITRAIGAFGPFGTPPNGWLPSPIFTPKALGGVSDNQADMEERFAGYIEMPDTRSDPDHPISARVQNAEEFLLISPGEDRLYGPDAGGKCDDITNFDVKTTYTFP
ncbi:MAG: type II secretion system protein [Phycisphaerae bacterium]|nr:type II secretion system protein [Phycisphaerae bacterium]